METSSSKLIKCLICGLHKCSNQDKDQLKDNEVSLISKHLQVIFLLRNILDVPSTKLVIFLKSHPNLESWLSVCDKCTSIVNKCKTTYQKYLTAQRKFRTEKQEILQILKRSALVKREISNEGDDLGDDIYDKPLDIVEEIRGFVSQNHYPKNIDPFISGDDLAYQHLTRKLDKALQQLEDEDVANDNQSWINEDLPEDNHEEWVPSETEEEPFIPMTTQPKRRKNRPQKIPKSTRALKQKWTLGTFSCSLCPKTFPYQNYLDRHIKKIHELSSSSNCATCGCSFPNPVNLAKHQISCTGQSLPCPVPTCTLKLASQPSLTNHLRNIHGSSALQKYRPPKKPASRAAQRKWTSGTFPCDLCPKTFPYQNYLDRHISAIHELSRSADCDLCGATILNGNTLVTHQKRCTGKSVPCPVPNCNLKLTTQAALTNHLRNNHNPETVEEYQKTCNFCGKTFAQNYYLKAHVKLIHGGNNGDSDEAIFKCDLCGVRKMTNGELSKHRENCKGKSLKCPVEECGMRFLIYNAFNNHVRSTHSDKLDELLPFKCLKCGEAYQTEKKLKYHMSAKHVVRKKGERFDESLGPFICETCGDTFPNRFLIERHRRSNVRCRRLRGEVVREEEVICEICGGSFKGKGVLGRHVQVVHNKRFTMKCELCGVGRNGRVRMEMHMWQRHKVGDEKKWRCGVDGCTVQIFGGRDREDHMRRHRGEEPGYRCGVCGKGFYMRVNIRQHVREVHEGKRCKRGGGGGKGKKEEEEQVGEGDEEVV